MTLVERLIAMMDHLGLARAHVATQMTGDVAGLAAAAPERIGGLVLCVPSRLDPTPFSALSSRVLMIAGARGMTAEITARAQTRLPGARRMVLADYDAPGWADVVTDRTGDIVEGVADFLSGHDASVPGPSATSGVIAGLAYRITGTGPALLLLPFFLAPSQWDAAIPALSERFTVIVLGGRHLGGVAALEDRATAPSYRGMVRTLLDTMAPRPGDTILDVGCGSGALDRMLAHQYGAANTIVATDLNPFLLREAATRAAEDGVDATIRFQQANAEALPFPDASFDVVLSHMMLHFLTDPQIAIAEAARVLRPRGRLILADFAPHDATVLGPDHAHRWPGFADETINGWMTEAGLVAGRSVTLAPPRALSRGTLTVKLWRGERPEPVEAHISAHRVDPNLELFQ